ncbi:MULTISPECIES: hypothetical protein [unclassified Microbacterium]|uniref:hypothetical protein n=1 Tax=unclassified Microbacterium TaxID=2609290 RepID=UPI001AC44023|nr:hypothetical protein [Microbacterium sp.]MBN9158739.1 hypothetical protein [Microbacterium sp.]MBS1898556.1 hypothetical protein [Actinomycetota bacterium]
MSEDSRFSLNSTLGEVLDDPRARALLDEIVPGVSTHSLVFLARGITLSDGAARLGSIEPERLAELDARLRELD